LIPEENSLKNIDNFPIYLDYTSWSSSIFDKEKLKLIIKAIEENKIIKFCYINNKNNESIRSVEPLYVVLKDFSWYLYSFCLLKNDYRLFKIKRMRKIIITEKTFIKKGFSFEDLNYQKSWIESKKNLNIILSFSSKAKMRVIDYFNDDQITFNEDGSSIVKFSFPEYDWLYEIILGFGNNVEVLKPIYLRNKIRKKVWIFIKFMNKIAFNNKSMTYTCHTLIVIIILIHYRNYLLGG